MSHHHERPPFESGPPAVMTVAEGTGAAATVARRLMTRFTRRGAAGVSGARAVPASAGTAGVASTPAGLGVSAAGAGVSSATGFTRPWVAHPACTNAAVTNARGSGHRMRI